MDTLSKFALFIEKIHKVFKNKVQGCSIPITICRSYDLFRKNLTLIACYSCPTACKIALGTPFLGDGIFLCILLYGGINLPSCGNETEKKNTISCFYFKNYTLITLWSAKAVWFTMQPLKSIPIWWKGTRSSEERPCCSC